MTVAFAAAMYERELARREQIGGAVSFSAGVLAFVGGLLGAVATGYGYPPGPLSLLFATSLIAAGLCFLWSVSYLVLSHVGHTYVYLPTPQQLHSYYVACVAHYGSDTDPTAAAGRDFDDLLLRRYVAAAEKNTLTNDRKAEALNQANRALATAMVPALLCGALCAIDARESIARRPTSVVTSALQENGMRLDTTDAAPIAEPSDAPPPKPVEPVNREIREGEIPPKRPVPKPS